MRPLYKAYLILKGFIRNLNEKNLWAYASSTAFFLFISLIPTMMLILLLLSYTPLNEQELLKLIFHLVPEKLDGVVEEYVTGMSHSSGGAVVLFTVLASIWGASNGMMGLLRGLNFIFGVEETRNYVVLRIESCLYTIGMIVILFATLVVMVFSGIATRLFVQDFPMASAITGFLAHFRMLLTPVVLSLFFTVMYQVVPNRKCSLISQLPGGIIAGVSWSVFSFLFSLYMTFAGTGSIYGGLSQLIFSMFWLYGCMVLLLFGAQVNVFFRPAFSVIRQRWRQRRLDRKAGS